MLAGVADLIPQASRPLLVAVDGVDGSGKTWFADELAKELSRRGRTPVRASVDDFHHPRRHRHRLGRTPESVWSRHFDYRALGRELLDPWLVGAGAPYRAAWHDVRSDVYVSEPAAPVPEAGILVMDAVFAQRAELEHAWDLVVFLDVPFEVSVARMAARDGTPADPDHPQQRRYVDAQRIYLQTCGPREGADVVVDNRELDSPRLVEVGLPAALVPAGWQSDGDHLVRTVRLPVADTATADAVNRLIDG